MQQTFVVIEAPLLELATPDVTGRERLVVLAPLPRGRRRTRAGPPPPRPQLRRQRRDGNWETRTLRGCPGRLGRSSRQIAIGVRGRGGETLMALPMARLPKSGGAAVG